MIGQDEGGRVMYCGGSYATFYSGGSGPIEGSVMGQY